MNKLRYNRFLIPVLTVVVLAGTITSVLLQGIQPYPAVGSKPLGQHSVGTSFPNRDCCNHLGDIVEMA